MASLTRWTWIWGNSGSWWWTGKPGMLQFMGSQRVGHDWVNELNWTESFISFLFQETEAWGRAGTFLQSFTKYVSMAYQWRLLRVHTFSLHPSSRVEVEVGWERLDPNLQNTMPDDLRWSWCNNNWNKMHINVMCLDHSKTISHPQSVKTVFHETGPQCRKGWGLLF